VTFKYLLQLSFIVVICLNDRLCIAMTQCTSVHLCVDASSEEWQKIVKSDREKIGLTFDNDGEFW